MIHMGSGHRCVMATLNVSMLGKKANHKDMKGYHETEKCERSTQAGKSISIELPELEKTPRNRRRNKKNTAATKEVEAQEKMKDTKAPAEREKAAAAEANRTQTTGRLDFHTVHLQQQQSSSSDSDDEMAGERLPKQRPHLSEETKDEEEVCLTTAKKGEELPDRKDSRESWCTTSTSG